MYSLGLCSNWLEYLWTFSHDVSNLHTTLKLAQDGARSDVSMKQLPGNRRSHYTCTTIISSSVEGYSVKLDSSHCCLVDSSDPCSALCQTALMFQHVSKRIYICTKQFVTRLLGILSLGIRPALTD